MNFRNFKEDIFSYGGLKTFKPSGNAYEYFDVSYYYKIGHYDAVSDVSNPDELNRRERSLLRYFNYLIFIYYRDSEKFDSERKTLDLFLALLHDKCGSRHHAYIDNSLYLVNDFATHGLKARWIGALPHLRLVCLLSAIGGYSDLLETLKLSLISKCDSKKLVYCANYNMLNPVASLSSGIFRFHEYPFKIEGPNSVLNCNLLAYALLIDVMDDQDAWADLAAISIAHMGKSSSLGMMAYAEEEDNPITPAYYDLEHSIYHSSGLRSLEIECTKVFEKPLSFWGRGTLLLKKILFRLSRGYK